MQLAVPHIHVVLLLTFSAYNRSNMLTKDENAHLLSTIFDSLGTFMYILLTF